MIFFFRAGDREWSGGGRGGVPDSRPSKKFFGGSRATKISDARATKMASYKDGFGMSSQRRRLWKGTATSATSLQLARRWRARRLCETALTMAALVADAVLAAGILWAPCSIALLSNGSCVAGSFSSIGVAMRRAKLWACTSPETSAGTR